MYVAHEVDLFPFIRWQANFPSLMRIMIRLIASMHTAGRKFNAVRQLPRAISHDLSENVFNPLTIDSR